MSIDPKKLLLNFAQECISKFPVIILGSGASAAYGIPGMPQLKIHLQEITCPSSANPEDAVKWNEFQSKLKTTDLETALNEVRLPESLTALVVKSTWDYLVPFDYQVFEKMVVTPDIFPLTKLFHHLFNSTRNEIHVVTPNYDRIAEYATDAGNLVHYTGFNYGHIRSRAINGKPQIRIGRSASRTVNIWKVHGSFDWFRNSDGIVWGLPVSALRPPNLIPVIVTPGIEKYRLTHDEPFHSIKSEADKALQNAEAYLCIGYGFNDPHLQTTLIERCQRKNVPLILLTKVISETTKTFLLSGKCGKYMAIEETSSGSRIFTAEFPAGEEIPELSVWQLDDFLKLVIS
jgi:hypothetical protein